MRLGPLCMSPVGTSLPVSSILQPSCGEYSLLNGGAGGPGESGRQPPSEDPSWMDHGTSGALLCPQLLGYSLLVAEDGPEPAERALRLSWCSELPEASPHHGLRKGPSLVVS